MYIKLFLGEKTAPGVFSFDYSKEFIRSCGRDEFKEKLMFSDMSFVDSPEVFMKVVISAVDDALDNEFKASEIYRAGRCVKTGKVCYICVNVDDSNNTQP